MKKEAVSSKTEPKDIVAVPKRRTKDQIKTLILNELEQGTFLQMSYIKDWDIQVMLQRL